VALIRKEKMKIYYFYNNWSKGCELFANDFKKLKEKYIDIDFIEIDTDLEENEKIIEKYDVLGVPTLIYFDENDNELSRCLASITMQKVERVLKI
jgi:thiol-disulfide isomerase/thioredoxin